MRAVIAAFVGLAGSTSAMAAEPVNQAVSPDLEISLEQALGQDVALVWSLPELDRVTADTVSPAVAAHGDHAATFTGPVFPSLAEAVRTPGVRQRVAWQDDTPPGWTQLETGLSHDLSGLTCEFEGTLSIKGGAQSKTVYLFQIDAFTEDFSDVACQYISQEGDYFYTVFASYWPDLSLEEHFSQGILLMKRDVANTGTQIESQVPVISTFGDDEGIAAQTLATGFDFSTPDGVPAQTALWLNKTESGWHVKVRGTYTPRGEFGQVFGLFTHKTSLDTVLEGARGSLGSYVHWVTRDGGMTVAPLAQPVAATLSDGAMFRIPVSSTIPANAAPARDSASEAPLGVEQHLPRF